GEVQRTFRVVPVLVDDDVRGDRCRGAEDDDAKGEEEGASALLHGAGPYGRVASDSNPLLAPPRRSRCLADEADRAAPARAARPRPRRALARRTDAGGGPRPESSGHPVRRGLRLSRGAGRRDRRLDPAWREPAIATDPWGRPRSRRRRRER